jgi:transcriptional regulator with XRE-family HTH domain
MDAEVIKFCREFGKQLALLRKQRGCTQEELAHSIGLHRTYIGFIEQGKRNPTVGTMHKIAQALQLDMKVFFPPY